MTRIDTTPAVEPVRKKEFVNYIHNFRGLAIITVVAAHILLSWPEGSPVYQFFRVFWENGTVLFIFIAGYLFQFLSARFEYGDYLKKKFQYVILPYLVISIPIIFFRVTQHDYPGYLLEHHPEFVQYPAWRQVFQFLITGAHMQQLWFIPMITLYYLLAPVLLYIDRHPVLYWIIVPLAVVSLLVEREPFNDTPRMFAHFLSTYIFGMLLSRYRHRYLELAKRWWPVITALTIAAIAINLYLYPVYAGPLNYIQKMLMCLFAIYWLWRLDRYMPKFLSVLAEVSFGIFFVHYYLILAVRAVYLRLYHHNIPGNVLTWLLYLLIVMGGSVLLIRIVQKIMGRNSRYLIGV